MDAAGVPKYAHRRSGETDIEVADACELALCCVDDHLLMSAVDRYGRLGVAPIARAVGALAGERVALSPAGGGAGLGLVRLLDGSEAFAAKIAPGVRCEVLSSLVLTLAGRRSGATSVFTVIG